MAKVFISWKLALSSDVIMSFVFVMVFGGFIVIVSVFTNRICFQRIFYILIGIFEEEKIEISSIPIFITREKKILFKFFFFFFFPLEQFETKVYMVIWFNVFVFQLGKDINNSFSPSSTLPYSLGLGLLHGVWGTPEGEC